MALVGFEVQDEIDSGPLSEEGFECSTCHKTFSSRGNVKRHEVTIHGGKKTARCNVCNKDFDDQSKLRRHLSTTHNEDRPFGCVSCEKQFKTKDDLVQHLSLHSGAKPHVCTTCGKTFAKKGNLRQHQVTHTDERPFCCQQCGQCFKQKHELSKHQKKVHFENREKKVAEVFNCDQCGKNFKLKKTLSAHQRKCNTNETKEDITSVLQGKTPRLVIKRMAETGPTVRVPIKAFTCKTCDKSFNFRFNLNAHEKRHKMEQVLEEEIQEYSPTIGAPVKMEKECVVDKPFGCMICHTGFGTPDELTTHVSSHNAKKTCTTCNKSFASSESLAAHKKGCETPLLVCKTCSETFLGQELLAAHLCMPSMCKTCEQTFSDQDSLAEHQEMCEKKPAVEQLVCTPCDKSFTNGNSLKSHIMKHLVSDKPNRKNREVVDLGQSETQTSDKTEAAPIFEDTLAKPLSLVCSVKICEETFKRVGKAVSLGHTESNEKTYYCHICKEDILVSLTETHQEIHSGLKPFNCPKCAASFRSKGGFKQHSAKDCTQSSRYLKRLAKNSPPEDIDSGLEKSPESSGPELQVVDPGMDPMDSLALDWGQEDSQQQIFNCLPCVMHFTSQEDWKAHQKMHGEEAWEKFQLKRQKLKRKTAETRVKTTHKASVPRDSESTDSKPNGLQQTQKSEDIFRGFIDQYPCKSCDKTFGQKNLLEEHQSDHAEDKAEIFNCLPCVMHFTSQKDWKAHQQMHGEDAWNRYLQKRNKIKSHESEKESESVGQIVQTPVTNNEEAKTFSCVDCKMTFMKREHLLIHKWNECTRKGQEEKMKKKLVKKRLEQKKRRELKCKFCKTMFKSFKGLEGHQCNFHCNVCEMSFDNTHGWRNHQTMHRKYGPETYLGLKCLDCDITFNKREHLKRHARLHTGEKPYECKTCGMTFRLSHNMKSHEKRHAVELKCKLCNEKPFQTTQSFRAHMRFHAEEGDLAFKCTICKLDFKTRALKKRHDLIHLKPEEKPYSCESCGHTFAYKHNYIDHVDRYLGKCRDMQIKTKKDSNIVYFTKKQS